MKIKTTEKEIKRNFKKIYYCNYCDINNLLSVYNADYYTAGKYGWNADVYVIGFDTVIVTGYRPFGNIKIENYKELEEQAKKILKNEKTTKEIKLRMWEIIENNFLSI